MIVSESRFLLLGIALVLQLLVGMNLIWKGWPLWLGTAHNAGAALLVVATPVNGARRWLTFGPAVFQPSELAKLACIFFTALILERRMHRIDELSYSLLPIGIVVSVMVALILLQPAFGTAMSLVLIVGGFLKEGGVFIDQFSNYLIWLIS